MVLLTKFPFLIAQGFEQFLLLSDLTRGRGNLSASLGIGGTPIGQSIGRDDGGLIGARQVGFGGRKGLDFGLRDGGSLNITPPN